MMQRAILFIPWGPQSFRKTVLQAGNTVIVGRSPASDLSLPHDRELADTHLELFWDGSSCQVRALNADEPILLNGQSALEGVVQEGGWFKAGGTVFVLHLEHHTPPSAVPDPAWDEARKAALSGLRAADRHLYAVLDAARSPRILELLRESPDEARSLYEGPKGDAMADVAPYLVRLDPGGWLLEALIHEGWGQAWGIYLQCPLPFREVRRHLRHFLRVKEEGAEDFLYFRFYDPRVLRIFLPTCSSRQLDQFFGPVRSIWSEGEGQEAIEFVHEGGSPLEPGEFPEQEAGI